ncbi:MAG: toprim domain-containing protein, partial [Bacilli bacterium]|nr:toprim domain-containing protein [Bacilli bacterium]
MKDVLSFERTNKFNGKYFILNGLISPLKGKDASSLHLDNLKKIIEEDGVKEVILATSSTLEGETTALYINRYLESMNIKISRLAYGLPIGADLEYVDGLTIERSLVNRVDMKRG